MPGRTGLLLFHRTENVREAFVCTEYTGAHWCRKRASGVPNGIRDVLVQGTRFWCTKWTKRCRWYRKRASGVPTRTRHQFRASGRKLWQNSRCHSWFTSINLRCGRFRSKQLLFRVKKWWLYTRGDITDWSRVRKATFFTRCISPGSSATHCLIW